MLSRRQGRNNRGLSLIEYAIIIGVIITSFSMMNTYVKRGMQSRIKNITDHFFGGNSQSVETSATAKSSSTTDSLSDSEIVNQGFIGGQTTVITSESRDVFAQSTVSDTNSTYTPPFVGASAGSQKYAVTHSTTE